MTTKLYVGNLSYDTTTEKLREVFSEYGTVESVAIITDRQSGVSRGFAFVEMSSAAEAKDAMQALNGKQLEGRTLVVNEAKPRSERRGPKDYRRGRRR
jgi:RNA recognition motif-containing protein